MKKTGIIALLICIIAPFTANAQIFNDVPPSHWGYIYIEDLAKQGILEVDYYFHPNRFMSRAEVAKVLVMATTGVRDDQFSEEELFPLVDESQEFSDGRFAQDPSFTDVKGEDWFYP
ncbi:MAG TPA: S-layer homology domain-containing protein, partial [Candidatus Gracilibacteria bacterium]|nr:S-layer homology domain-containing protein [Candidatus Gracilibacteria bacterium]